MKRTTTKQSNPLQFVARCQFKNNAHAVLYAIQSAEKRYTVTLVDGRVTGCQCGDEQCPSYKFRGTCKHAERALALECERDAQLAEAATIVAEVLPEMAKHNDVQVHVEDSVRSGELSWAEQQHVARAAMTADEREEQLLALGERRWMAA